MNASDVAQAAAILERAQEAEGAALDIRGADRIDVTMGRRGYSSLPAPKCGLPLAPADTEVLAVAFEAIAKRLRGEAAALLVGPVEVGQ